MAYPLPLRLLAPAVLLSGSTALVYEIVWARRLSLVLGSTTVATSAVLSSFMLGLALGAVTVGRRADTSRRPLRWYGILEIGIGLYALAFDPVLALAAGPLAGRPFLLACAVLLLPAALMGATLPVLARAGAHTTERGTAAFGSLYGLNTLGAVAGAMLTAFYLLENFGLSGSVRLAAAANIALGVLFWGLSRSAGEREVFAPEGECAVRGWSGNARPAVLFAFFLAGFAGLALEMAWTRLLVYFLEGFTIAFALMLAAYLLGLGSGALAGTVAALQTSNPRRLLGRILLVEAVLALGTFLLADRIGISLEEMRRGYTEADTMDFSYRAALFGAAAAIVFPATFCAGMLMPVVARIALSDREAIGHQTGVVYAATTLGAVAAPPVAGFWLIPLLGVPGTIAAMAALVLAAGTVLSLSRGLPEWLAAAAAAAVFVAIWIAAGIDEPLVRRSHVFVAAKTPRRLREFREGRLAGVSVVEELRDGTRRLYIDDFSAAETSRHYGYMRMLGHLPVLLHPAPRRVCVIAFGTGTTAGAVAAHPEVKELTCVEIEQAVYDVAPQFQEQSRGVLGGARTRALVADGREFVARAGEPFDVITLEPLMPYTPAAVYLYTKEFYEAARGRLAKGGLLCQWIPPHGVSNRDFRRLVASMTAVFDHVSLWFFSSSAVLLGGDGPPRIDGGTLLERCAVPAVASDLRTALVGDAAHVLGAHVCSGAVLVNALEGAEPMVDDRTDLEFRPLPRRFGKRSARYLAENLEFMRDAGAAAAAARAAAGGSAWPGETVPGVETALASGRAVVATLALEARRRHDGGEAVTAAALADVVRRDKLALHGRAIHERRLYGELMAQGRIEEAARLSFAPDRSAAYLALADEFEGRKRLHYLTLAVRQNALIGPVRLRELAGGLEGPERRFCLNRARAMEGEPLDDGEEGEEALPSLAMPDLRPALDAWDADAARETLEDAANAGLLEEVDREAWDWWQAVADKRRATAFLHRIGSRHVLRAALRLHATGKSEDLVAVAAVFVPRHPANRIWERLCGHRLKEVRQAAAEAAQAAGGRAHLPQLAILCGDTEEGVRLSAYLAFREIVGPDAAEKTGYDHRDPTADALASLARLAGE